MTEDFSAWIGKQEIRHDRFDPARSNALLAALGEPGSAKDGDPVPLLHHWLYFWDVQPPAALGPDGHPAKGGFLPPVPLPRRMWAGGRLRFEAPLRFGEVTKKRSTILNIETKQGRSGTLVFVTLEHRLTGSAGLAVTEQQDIVYRAASLETPPLPVPLSAAPPCAARREISPDTVLLLRYSALTMNGHRIHYDRPYAIAEEAYPALVVHGPLQATLLAALIEDQAAAPLKSFEFRGESPAFDAIPLHICVARADAGFTAWTQQGEARNMVANAAV